MGSTVLLLTACVNPNGTAYTMLQDSNERLRQYREGLDWYLKHVSNKIVFVENTGYDISPMYEEAITAGRLEVLTFQGNDFDKSKGKGYGEALIIEYALNNSEFLKGDVNVVKITGRLICENVAKMAGRYINTEVVYGMKIKDSNGIMAMSSQVIVAPPLFWKDYFVPQKELINDSLHYWFEHLLLDAIEKWQNDGHSFKDMWIPIILRGQSGSTGEIIKTGIKGILSFYTHYWLHRFGYYGPVKFWNKEL